MAEFAQYRRPYLDTQPGLANAVPVDREEYDRLRPKSLADAEVAKGAKVTA